MGGVGVSYDHPLRQWCSIFSTELLVSVTADPELTSSNVQLLQGTVRQIDRRNGRFTVDLNGYNMLTVTLYNPSNVDVNRFNSLRTGEFVRFYGTYINSSEVQLRQFY